MWTEGQNGKKRMPFQFLLAWIYSQFLQAWFSKVQNRDERWNSTSGPYLPASNLQSKQAGLFSHRWQYLPISLSACWWVYCVCMCHPAVSELCPTIWAVNTTTTGIFSSPSHYHIAHFGLLLSIWLGSNVKSIGWIKHTWIRALYPGKCQAVSIA